MASAVWGGGLRGAPGNICLYLSGNSLTTCTVTFIANIRQLDDNLFGNIYANISAVVTIYNKPRYVNAVFRKLICIENIAWYLYINRYFPVIKWAILRHSSNIVFSLLVCLPRLKSRGVCNTNYFAFTLRKFRCRKFLCIKFNEVLNMWFAFWQNLRI